MLLMDLSTGQVGYDAKLRRYTWDFIPVMMSVWNRNPKYSMYTNM